MAGFFNLFLRLNCFKNVRRECSNPTAVAHHEEDLINQKLPAEVFLRIFSYLDVASLSRCAQVSRAWNVLALDWSNWRDINLSRFNGDIEDCVVENISRCSERFLNTLSLKGCTNITDSSCISLSVFCHNLLSLDLASCTSITDKSLKMLSKGCPHLEKLDISWNNRINEEGLEALLKGCVKLQSLSLRGCIQLEDDALSLIGKHCPELRTLNLQDCSDIMDDGVVPICVGCPKLQSLCISGCSFITDATLNALGENCPRLRVLEVANCVLLTDVGFTNLARNCHELETIDLRGCREITDITVMEISMQCPRLQVLTLSGCRFITNDGIRLLANGACARNQLVVLELDNCPLITDACLEYLSNCQSLQWIHLFDCEQITQDGIKRLQTYLPNIKVHAYFPPVQGRRRWRFWGCCGIL